MAYGNSFHHGGSYSAFNAEKMAQFVAACIAIVGMIETFFVLKESKSFLSANIPYLQFDVTSPAYGFVIAITLAVSIAVVLGLSLRTIAITGIMFWLSISGVVSCSDKGVKLDELEPTTLLQKGNRMVNEIKDSLTDYSDKSNTNTDDIYKNLKELHPSVSSFIINNDVSDLENHLKSEGLTVKFEMEQQHIEWCLRDEALKMMLDGNRTAWVNCTTKKVWHKVK